MLCMFSFQEVYSLVGRQKINAKTGQFPIEKVLWRNKIESGDGMGKDFFTEPRGPFELRPEWPKG